MTHQPAPIQPPCQQRQQQQSSRQQERNQIGAQVDQAAYLFPDKAAILAGPVKAVTLFHEQRHKAAYFSEISQQFRALPILERDKLRISTLN